MPRKPRVHGPNTTYHVTVVATGGAPFFTCADDRLMMYRVFDYVNGKLDVEVRAFVLMTTHLHFIVWTAEDEISRFVQLVTGIYCQAFNREHGRKGHLVTGRFWSKVIDKPGQAVETFRYIVMNPVRAGIVERPEDWRWSSYRATIKLEAGPAFLDTSWILDHFDDDPFTAAERVKAFIDATVLAELEAPGVRPLNAR